MATGNSKGERRGVSPPVCGVTGLKKQRMELEQQEAKAVAVLKQKLKEANQKAAQLGGYAEERKIEAKEALPFPSVRPDVKNIDSKKE